MSQKLTPLILCNIIHDELTLRDFECFPVGELNPFNSSLGFAFLFRVLNGCLAIKILNFNEETLELCLIVPERTGFVVKHKRFIGTDMQSNIIDDFCNQIEQYISP